MHIHMRRNQYQTRRNQLFHYYSAATKVHRFLYMVVGQLPPQSISVSSIDLSIMLLSHDGLLLDAHFFSSGSQTREVQSSEAKQGLLEGNFLQTFPPQSAAVSP